MANQGYYGEDLERFSSLQDRTVIRLNVGILAESTMISQGNDIFIRCCPREIIASKGSVVGEKKRSMST